MPDTAPTVSPQSAVARPAPSGHGTCADGWTPDRQARFLAAIAEGFLVRDACQLVGLTPTAAYAFRRRAGGAAFALGWAAANLHAREVLADTLFARALEGQVDIITRADGSVVERHRYDNRLAQAMLARLDRLADAEPVARPAAAAPATADTPAADPAQAVRSVAAGFDAYLDLIATDAGPARARLFVACALAEGEASVPALAHADRWLRAGDPDATADDTAPDTITPATPGAVQATTCETSPTAPPPTAPPLAPPPPTAPSPAAGPAPRNHARLDPADRAAWTATDWARAEAAGLLTIIPPAPAAPPANAATRTRPPELPGEEVAELMQSFAGRARLLEHALAVCDAAGTGGVRLSTDPDVGDDDADGDSHDAPAPRVWRHDAKTWRTNFIAPPGFTGWQEFDHGDPDYNRALSWEEQEVADRWEAANPARIAAAAERDAWFAAGGAPWHTSDARDAPDAPGDPAPAEHDAPARAPAAAARLVPEPPVTPDPLPAAATDGVRFPPACRILHDPGSFPFPIPQQGRTA
ncbi:MAG TPA: hypothetical protein VF649_13410 [Sphingomonas sp.]|uniref:hypothetical protein n=1 Tax=Sphingomonas sp. TaxID=28214 RepID=UPI002ED8402B